jgi:two-component system sensor histidine kinase KdpD
LGALFILNGVTADKQGQDRVTRESIVQYLMALGVVALATAVAFLSKPLIEPEGMALVFLLGVVVLAFFVRRGPTLFAAVVGALLWAFYFLPPIHALRIRRLEDVTLFAIYFIIALALGYLTARLRSQQRMQLLSESAKVAEASERLSKTLLDSMSHEIRTPIAAIQSAVGHLTRLLERDSSDSAGKTKAMIAEIQEATARLNRVVGNVLDITRLTSGAVKPRLNECDVAEVVNLAVSENEKETEGHPVTVAISPGLPIVQMDFVLTQQALSNLLSNAGRHTPPGTPIEVAARVENEEVALRVADRGPGISPELLPKIFDKFYRGPNAATGGTGLGLSLVKGFVEAQGGRVTAENGAGGGMIFSIRLPLRRASAPSAL